MRFRTDLLQIEIGMDIWFWFYFIFNDGQNIIRFCQLLQNIAVIGRTNYFEVASSSNVECISLMFSVKDIQPPDTSLYDVSVTMAGTRVTKEVKSACRRAASLFAIAIFSLPFCRASWCLEDKVEPPPPMIYSVLSGILRTPNSWLGI